MNIKWHTIYPPKNILLIHGVEMKSALSETLCFQSFGHLLYIFMHYHVYFSMFMSCTFFDRIPSCGCNLSSIIHCSGHKDHMLYRVLGILCGLILWVKDLSSPSLDFCKFSDTISSLKMCKRDVRPCRPSYFTFSHSEIPFFPIQNLYLFLCLYSSGCSSWAYQPYAFSIYY